MFDWTNLPDEIEPEFVSYSGDYDYPLYLSDKQEWIHYKDVENPNKITVFEPFLIMELNRFIPFIENNLIKFHPLNMPYIKIGKIDIIGFVVGVSDDAERYEYQVDDGTGTITIFFQKRMFAEASYARLKIDEKYRSYAKNMNIAELPNQKCPKRFPKLRPDFKYPPNASIKHVAILENNWSEETNNGLLGKMIERHDYVHAIGYCGLDFMFEKKPTDDITFDHLSTAKLYFYANKVTRIEEHKYNAKFNFWLNTVVRRRYDKNFKR